MTIPAGRTDEKDLPLHCPMPGAPLWARHPRVFLDVVKEGEALCPYCGTKVRYKGPPQRALSLCRILVVAPELDRRRADGAAAGSFGAPAREASRCAHRRVGSAPPWGGARVATPHARTWAKVIGNAELRQG
jgi:uncharacterized Zn-finger protein